MDMTPEENDMARVIWETSRADEQSVSATGANFIARALTAAGYGKIDQEKSQEPQPWQLWPGRVTLVPNESTFSAPIYTIPAGYALVAGQLVRLP